MFNTKNKIGNVRSWLHMMDNLFKYLAICRFGTQPEKYSSTGKASICSLRICSAAGKP